MNVEPAKLSQEEETLLTFGKDGFPVWLVGESVINYC